MREIYRELAEALGERLAIIADEGSRQDATRHTARLEQVSAKIERIEQELPAAIDPQLRHFLQRRSYSKALALIEELEELAPPGN